MVRHFEQMSVDTLGPTNNFQIHHILSGRDELNEKSRVFGYCTLEPGTEMPLHRHEGESETWFFLSGEGDFIDDGVSIPIHQGDAAHVFSDHSHGLRNTGDKPLKYITLVLYSR